MRLLLAVFTIFASFQAAPAQRPSVTPAQFKAALKAVMDNAGQWQKTIDQVDIESLPISYSAGKVYDKNKTIVSEDLKLVVLWAKRMEHDDGLFAEVNFLSSIQELQNQLQQFSSLLLDASPTDKATQAKVNSWSEALTGIANTTVNDAYQTAFIHTTARALRMDEACASIGPSDRRNH